VKPLTVQSGGNGCLDHDDLSSILLASLSSPCSEKENPALGMVWKQDAGLYRVMSDKAWIRVCRTGSAQSFVGDETKVESFTQLRLMKLNRNELIASES
jgi:hypothetical protein